MAPITIPIIASSLRASNANRISHNAAIQAAGILRPPSWPYRPALARAGQITLPSSSSSTVSCLNYRLCYLFLLAFLLSALATLLLHFEPVQKTGKHKKGHSLFVLFWAGVLMVFGVVFRMVYANNVKDIQVATVSSILPELAATILIVVSLRLLLRFAKAQTPRVGWSKWTKQGMGVYIGSIAIFFLIYTISLIQPLHTLSPRVLRADTFMQRISTTYLAVAAFLPLTTLTLLHILSHFRVLGQPDPINHGYGPRSTRLLLLAVGSFLLSLRTVFLALISYFPRPRDQPAWYHGSASFYCLTLLPILAFMVLYCAGDVGGRFWFPEGYTGPEREKRAEWPGQELGDLGSLGIGGSSGGSEESASCGLKRVASDEVEIERMVDRKARLSVGSPLRRNGRY